MRPPPFIVFYLVSLSIIFGGIEWLRSSVGLVAEMLPEVVETLSVVAVPPKPQGVRDVSGDGDGDGYRYSEQECAAQTGELRDVCFHQLARQRAATDLSGALLACDKVDQKRFSQECMADVAELHAVVDKSAALAVCPTIGRKKWRDQCVFGVALALSQVESAFAFNLCDKAGMWRDFCRHDVNGEIAQVNAKMAQKHCAAESGDLLTRKSCWHGIGKYIARKDVQKAFTVCSETPSGPNNTYIENCFHGVGWGGAEGDGVSFSNKCTAAGLQEDSCRLGVAYNVRRFEEVQAMSVCSTVVRADLRSQCELFVRSGAI